MKAIYSGIVSVLLILSLSAEAKTGVRANEKPGVGKFFRPGGQRGSKVEEGELRQQGDVNNNVLSFLTIKASDPPLTSEQIAETMEILTRIGKLNEVVVGKGRTLEQEAKDAMSFPSGRALNNLAKELTKSPNKEVTPEQIQTMVQYAVNIKEISKNPTNEPKLEVLKNLEANLHDVVNWESESRDSVIGLFKKFNTAYKTGINEKGEKLSASEALIAALGERGYDSKLKRDLRIAEINRKCKK